ncbi:MAG: site-specific DNA-methyltransferase [Patescibacteria group bacterium]|nr:site-specific DNA-methyltransferase [Patescibacteria group bacterium]
MLELNMVHCGDSAELLKQIPDNSVHACVTDPPAGISFMGKKWDSDKGGRDQWIAWLAGIMSEVKRTLMPGGYAIVWALPRTSHWTARAVEDSGLEIRDICHYAFGSGFPKSMDISKAIDKAAGAEREDSIKGGHIGISVNGGDADNENELGNTVYHGVNKGAQTKGTPATDLAREWEGFGTALKPAIEHWIVARKPLEGTVVENVLKYGTGAMDIDGSRVEGNYEWRASDSTSFSESSFKSGSFGEAANPSGRFPANLIHDNSPEVLAMFPDSAGQCGDVRGTEPSKPGYGWVKGERPAALKRSDSGSAARFFKSCPFTEEDYQVLYYCAKASKAERNYGCDSIIPQQQDPSRKEGNPGGDNPRNRGVHAVNNNHPTVKPIALISYLIGLVSREGDIVLDPFAGSGTTGVACKRNNRNFILIELDPHNVEIAEARIAAVQPSQQLSLF